jgi:beta-N-acetylhexosaminidase
MAGRALGSILGSMTERRAGLVRAVRRSVVVAAAAAVLATAPRPAVADDAVDRAFDALTPAQRVGQLFIVTFDGADLADGTDIAGLIDDGHVGGILLDPSRGNFANGADAPLQVARLANALQARAAAVDGPYVPLLIALRQQGDGFPASALHGGMTPLPSPMALGATWDPGNALRVGELVGRELAAVGVNLVFAPPLDVLTTPRPTGSGDLGVQAFGGSPSWVGRFGQRFVEGIHLGGDGRVAIAPSSFPGVGGVDRSPTDEVAVVERTLDELTAIDLVPFLAVTDPTTQPSARSDALMTSHVRFRGIQQQADRPFALDSGGLRYLSAQLSPFAGWLAEGGVIVSPGLGLPAVRRYVDPDLGSFNERRVIDEALAAGNDLLLLTRFGPPDDPDAGTANARAAIDWLVERYGEDDNVREAVDRAARRVLALKSRQHRGLPAVAVQVDADGAAGAVGLGRDQVAAVARAALTAFTPPGASVGGAGTASPRPGERVLFVVDAREVRECAACAPYSDPDPQTLVDVVVRNYGAEGTGRLRAASDVDAITFTDLKSWMQTHGLVPAEDTPVTVAPLTPERLAEVDRLLRGADWIVFAMRDPRPLEDPGSDALKLFLSNTPPAFGATRLVAIALAAPYYLDTTEIAKLTAYYAVYAHTEPFVEVAVRALFGDVPPSGASPVSVPGAGYDLATQLEPDVTQDVALELVGWDAGKPVQEGDEITVRTSVVRDANGRAAPNGTDVTFQRFDRAEGVFLADVPATTVEGQATASMRAERDGELVITAAFDNGLRSEPLALAIRAAGLTGDGLPLPQVPLPSQLVRARVPVDWGIFLLTLTLILLVGVLFYGTGTEARPAAAQVRLFLLSLAWGLAGYVLVAAGGLHVGMLPGGDRLWSVDWNPAYQAALFGFVLALSPVVPSLWRALKGSTPARWVRRR